MLNMSNPFYKYISNQLVVFFEQEATRNKTDRYYLYLPTEEIIKNIYKEFKKLANIEPFVYKHEKGTKPYETIAIILGDLKYVIASTMNNTNIDFLVTLRNEMSEQKGEWKNTSLILLCDTLNDSVRGGNQDLIGEGFPLHVSQIVGNLEDLLKDSKLNAIEQKVTSHYLNRREAEHYIENSSFLDFEEVLSLVHKGELEHEDYRSLQYFEDAELQNLIKEQEKVTKDSVKWKQIERKIDNRLKENNQQFEEIERLRLLGNSKERFEEEYDKGANKLNRDDWYTVDFTDIEDWREAAKEKKAIEFFSDKVTVKRLVDGDYQPLDFWKRPISNTAAGRRTWSLIIFHPDYKEGEKVEITFPFDRHTSEKYLNSISKNVAGTSGKKVIAELELEQKGATFGRVVYKHENATSGNYTFNFVVVACKKEFFENYRTSFQVVATSKKKRAIQLTLDNQNLLFGDGALDVELNQQGQSVSIDTGALIKFTPGVLDDSEKSIVFSIVHPRFEMPIEVADEVLKTIHINGKKLWETKRSMQRSFYTDDEAKRVEIDNLPYITYEEDRTFLLMEFEWLKQRMRQGSVAINTLIAEQTTLPPSVEKAYDEFIDAVEQTETIPSLLYYTHEVKLKAEEYIKAYIEAIDGIRDQQIMTNEERGLFYLGSVKADNVFYMTPFSPLNVAYQLQINEESKGSSIDLNILNKLNAVYTLPYIVTMNGKLFKPTVRSRLAEWHSFLPSEKVTVGETNSYLAQLVEEKLDQFCDNYDYLFELDLKAAILLNVVNIPNDQEVLHGIVNWYKKQIKNNNTLANLRPIQLVAYTQEMDGHSAFDVLNDGGNSTEIGNRLGINFSINDNYIAEDVLQAIQQVLHYSKRSINEEMQYTHITFYKMKTEEEIVKQLVKDAPSSMNLNGLFTTVTSSKSNNGGYRVGFGTGQSIIDRSLFSKFAVKLNELAANMTDRGQNPYTKGVALSMHINDEDEEYLSQLYRKSHWLTFVDPVVDLKYFQQSSKNLVIVHYSDQLSSSNHYDAITVTDKSEQYFNVIQDFLKSQNVIVDDANIENIIRLFNTFNGEWLLRAVQGRSYDKREKMSVVSAIKQALVHFNNPDVLWVPISMEEIVRVAGNVKLSKKDGIFSGKTIGKRGNCSDDLLMIGLEQAKDGLKLHLYPVEVKIGINDSSVIEKGISQVKELNERLNEQLIEQDTFDARFLRNFFTRLFIANASKMVDNQVWPEKDYTISPDILDKLLNDEFEIVNTLRADYGHGLVISFKKNASMKVKERRKGVMVLQHPEQNGYDTLAIPINELTSDDYQVGNSDVDRDTGNTDRDVGYSPETDKDIKPSGSGEPTEDTLIDKGNYSNPAEDKQVTQREETASVAVQVASKKALVRPLIGIKNIQEIYWEFDHKQLSNRHLLIGGRSGQGKTYFIQTLLKNLSKSNQSAVVLDYSSSYTRAQLDPVFLANVGDKLRERIVYHEGFPLNPFLRREKEVAGKVGKEKPTEVARRVVDVFASVYRSFGSQQKNALYEAVKRGIELYDDKMKMEHLLEILEEMDGYANSVISSITSRIVQLVDIDPFDYDSRDQWKEYFAPGGNITIIQLAGYDQEEIKRIMAEFILWDLWYFTQSGTKDKPIPVILDEAQNLDFSDGSPAAKILREGRKFGWSAWFATQSFNNFSKDELSILDNAGTKVYFNPADSEVRVLASRIGNATQDELRRLQKGQCLVLGQFVQSDQTLGAPSYHIVKVPAMDKE